MSPGRGVPPRPASRAGAAGADGSTAGLSAGISTSIEVFLLDYREHLPEPPRLGDDPFHNFERLLAAIRRTPYRLYLLIDEYDNFANEIVTSDAKTYHDLVQSDGPFKYLFKWVKGLMAGGGLERLFITGVSPMVMSDVTSGMNVARNVYLKPALAELCGFTEVEVDELLTAVLRERGDCELSADDARQMMREWYNGYRFALGVPERVYSSRIHLPWETPAPGATAGSARMAASGIPAAGASPPPASARGRWSREQVEKRLTPENAVAGPEPSRPPRRRRRSRSKVPLLQLPAPARSCVARSSSSRSGTASTSRRWGGGRRAAAIQAELRSQYLLAYQSSHGRDDAGSRTIEVTVSSGGEARTLRGYYP